MIHWSANVNDLVIKESLPTAASITLFMWINRQQNVDNLIYIYKAIALILCFDCMPVAIIGTFREKPELLTDILTPQQRHIFNSSALHDVQK